MFRTVSLALLAFLTATATAKVSPQAAVDELIAADRAFSAGAAKAADIPSGIASMFDSGVVMPVPGSGHAVGREAVVKTFRDDLSFKEGSASWTPVRGGISADGTQGFTYGFLTLTAGDPAKRERKYLSYWIKQREGWRVAAYRQNVRDAGEVSHDMIAPSLPGFTADPSKDAAIIAAHQHSVAAAEKSFSDRAQYVGLKKAFREYGRDDAMNMYVGAGFTLGLDAITAGFKDEPATINWSTERSFAASSGDLGVSIGTIRSNDPKQGADFPFFTVWRRDGLAKPWRYVAE